MFRLSRNKISLAASALILCAGFAQAQTEPVTPVTAAPTSVSINYQLPSTAGAAEVVTLTIASGADLFTIDPSTVPYWLTVTNSGNTVIPASPGPAVTLSFQASSAAGTLNGGVYSASVHVRVSGYQDLVIPVTLAVADTASTVTVQYSGSAESDGATIPLTWVYGSSPYPTATLNVLSSDAPIAFTAASSVSSPSNTVNWIQLSAASGIAYNYGTPLNITFLSDILQNATVGQTLTGQVAITYGTGPTTIHINFAITVGEPNAAVTSISPAYAPPASTGSMKVVVTGSGFTSSSATCLPATCGNPTAVQITYTGDNSGGSAIPVSLTGSQVGGSISVVSPNTMILTIPAMDTQSTPVNILAAGSITLSIANGSQTPVTQTLTITTAPIIYSITDAASLVTPAAGATPTFAPYEMVTIFGANFGATTATVGTLDSTSRYPTSMSVTGGTLSVEVNKQDGTLIADASILFASSDQLNIMVPSGILASGITGLQFVVTLGTHSSQPFLANPVAANPGVFTTTSSGQGQGAVLLSNYSVNSDTNKAAPGSTILIYASGLGTPNSTAADTASSSAAKFPTSCISPANYVAAEGITNPATADGAVILGSKIATNLLPPCFATANQVTVTIGGQAATVTYAGWVADSVSGLYQINATVPTKATAGDLPVVVTVTNGKVVTTSQAGVTVAVN